MPNSSFEREVLGLGSIRVGLIGFGVVGTGFVKLLYSNRDEIESRTGLRIELIRVVDKDIETPRGVEIPSHLLSTDPRDVIEDPRVDVVVELIGGIEPARSLILDAMRKGKHVVTANKALISTHWEEIMSEASKNGVEIGFEASVGGGIPIIQSLGEGLVANRIRAIYGIINGTTNYILTRMTEDGWDFEEALGDAKAKGYAEADPSLDIDGIDATHKIVILANIAFGTNLKVEDVYREGINGITALDIRYALEEFGYVIKSLAIARKYDDEFDIRVHPALIPKDHVLASVRGVMNAIYVEGDAVGPLTFCGYGAGQMPAASSVMSDLIRIGMAIKRGSAPAIPFRISEGNPPIRNMGDHISKYYVRLMVEDIPGVLSRIFGIVAERDISVAALIQRERGKEDVVPIVILTHEARERDLKEAMERVSKLPFVKADPLMIRVEEARWIGEE
jgi:homoserine dehydrogenase